MIGVILCPYLVKADAVVNCGKELGSEVEINVTPTKKLKFYILGDTESLLANGSVSTSTVRLISKDYLIDSSKFSDDSQDISVSSLGDKLAELVSDWENIDEVGLLNEYDLEYYFNGGEGESINEFLYSLSDDTTYWTEVADSNDDTKVMVIDSDGNVTSKGYTELNPARIVVEMQSSKVCSFVSNPSGNEDNARTGDFDVILWVGAGLALVCLMGYSYKKAKAV